MSRPLILLSLTLTFIISVKAYPTVNSQNAKYLTALGRVCSATEKLPPSAVLSVGLKKRGNIAVASGGMTDLWRGDFCGRQAAIKAFRIYPIQDLKEAKKVCIQLVLEIRSQPKLTDPVETSARVEEVIPR